MKRFALIFVLILGVTSVAFSQNWFVGIGANFNFSTDSTTDVNRELESDLESRNISFSPEIGYRFDVLDFGIRPIFQYSYQGSDNSLGDTYLSINKTTNLGFGIGLFSRYKIITFFDKLSIFGRLDANYIFSNGEREFENKSGTNSQSGKTEIIRHNANIEISPVIEYKLSNRFSLYSSIIGPIVSLGYINSSENNASGDKYSRDNHSFNLTFPFVYNFSLTNISLGFYVTF